MSSTNIKDNSIETLRGLACILLISFHLVGQPGLTGLKLDTENFLVTLNAFFENIRMPLFTFLSGYVFCYRGMVRGSELKILIGKSKRLLLPLISVGIPFLVIQNNLSVSNLSTYDSGILYYISILWTNKAHFWFLHAIFLVFLILVILSYFDFNVIKYRYILFMISVLISLITPQDIKFLSISGFSYILPFFMFGVILYEKKISSNIARYVLIIGAIFTLIIYNSFGYYYQEYDKLSDLVISLICLFSLYTFCMKFRLLAYIGGYSFTIYLYHVFFIVLSRILLRQVGIYNEYVHLVFGIAVTICLSKFLHDMLSKNGYLSVFFLGQQKK
ncbi:acyltransferase family protein [Shewanella gaetbuli]|uniref:acyltransferase family protein n=1 Tax=Shewanella gaetbuli TaxID=220752 RepID=UPI003B838D14